MCGVYAQRGYVRVAAAPAVQGRRRRLAGARRVLFLNPKSGGGKVEQFDLVAEARRRGVEAVVLERDDDLTALAERAVADGAEVLGMAGGDGSQADVAAVCVAHDLPFVCIPAGTRNHFALDLNLDRVRPAAGTRRLRRGHRDPHRPRAGRRPLLRQQRVAGHVPLHRRGSELPRRAAQGGGRPGARPDGGRPDHRPAVHARPRARPTPPPRCCWCPTTPTGGWWASTAPDAACRSQGGELGVLVLAAADAEELAAAARRLTLGVDLEHVAGCDQWTAPELRIDSAAGSVLAGVDGEAMELPTPLVIRVVPAGLRVVVPVGTPAPPAATDRLLSVQALGSLLEIAGGVDQGPYGDDL